MVFFFFYHHLAPAPQAVQPLEDRLVLLFTTAAVAAAIAVSGRAGCGCGGGCGDSFSHQGGREGALHELLRCQFLVGGFENVGGFEKCREYTGVYIVVKKLIPG